MNVIETPRLILRQFTLDDVEDLAAIHDDPIVMEFYPRTRTYEETKQQIERIINDYRQRGWGLWATVYKANNKFIGRCGLKYWLVNGVPETEIGYMLAKEYWGRGLATEAARAIRDYGFKIGCDYEVSRRHRLISLIDHGNIASQKVALKTGLTYEKDVQMWGKNVRLYAIYRSGKSLNASLR